MRSHVHFEYTNLDGRTIRCTEVQAKELAALKPHYLPRRVESKSVPVAVAGPEKEET